MIPLRERAVGALRLQPMSINQVARCLSVAPETARVALRRLERRGVVRMRGWVNGNRGKSSIKFEAVK